IYAVCASHHQLLQPIANLIENDNFDLPHTFATDAHFLADFLQRPGLVKLEPQFEHASVTRTHSCHDPTSTSGNLEAPVLLVKTSRCWRRQLELDPRAISIAHLLVERNIGAHQTRQ